MKTVEFTAMKDGTREDYLFLKPLEDDHVGLEDERHLDVRAEHGHDVGERLNLVRTRGGGQGERAADRETAEIEAALLVGDRAEGGVGRRVEGGDFRTGDGAAVCRADVARDAGGNQLGLETGRQQRGKSHGG